MLVTLAGRAYFVSVFSVRYFPFVSSNIPMSRSPFSGGPVEMVIRKKLSEKLRPIHLEVINESYKHNTPPNAETHFKMVVVSELFKDMTLVKRHQAINSLLTEELKTCVHAISIDAKTPDQWNANPEVNPTPKCLGGFGR
ncbi:DNA-binding transcriptional regulator BolA-like isoform X2 [Macrosteles quadrilineatus]|uniref:DNA-binding transcriptional regulator BolA-like isoform X2 n=1 Tax=Macrosteles quadrilineatus TaxID=74068 RepID=UPI0023E0B6CA|nr:DNA-binding transcriptional regulator BolA-like isoform X2 [Macrosteles quadrilineatus]